MAEYGRRAKAVFNSLGMRPVEILEGREDSVRLEEVVEELREDEEIETVLEPFVEKYFKVLNEKEMVEYEDNGSLRKKRSLRKNGKPDEDIQSFIESFGPDY
jgi:hypothetical protein